MEKATLIHCPRCKQDLPRDAFYPDKRRKVGVRGYCIACEDAIRKATPKKTYPPAEEDLRCPRCTRTRPAEMFSLDRSRKTSRKLWCKDCCASYITKQRDEHRLRVRKNYLEHRDERLACQRERRGPGGPQADYMKHYWATNRDRLLPQGRAYQLAHLEQERENHRRYRLSHPEAVRAALRAWCEKNPERARAISAASASRRRVALRGAQTEKVSREEIYTRDCGICQMCHATVHPRRWHMDHYIPVVLGGAHTRANLRVLCPTGNLSKGGRMPTDRWVAPVGVYDVTAYVSGDAPVVARATTHCYTHARHEGQVISA